VRSLHGLRDDRRHVKQLRSGYALVLDLAPICLGVGGMHSGVIHSEGASARSRLAG